MCRARFQDDQPTLVFVSWYDRSELFSTYLGICILVGQGELCLAHLSRRFIGELIV